jgi:RNA polymerase sigma factor (sigma-70 family)
MTKQQAGGQMGDQENEEFVFVFETNYADVLRYVQRRTRPALVEEVVAETFLIAWRRRHVLPDNPRPWLFRTAANVLKSTMRREARQAELAVRSYQPEYTPDPDAGLDLTAAWYRLSLRDREVIALHAWEGLSDLEASMVLGCTRSAYAMRLTRAKRRLVKNLQSALPGDADIGAYPRIAEERP